MPRIEAIWAKLDLTLESERAGKMGSAADKIRSEQIVNDQAYFNLCWGQLEIESDGTCRDVVRRRRTHADWRVRRGWDLYNPDEDRFSGLSFENRARLVLDASGTRGGAFGLVMKHYGIRNRIAHGNLELTRIAVSDFVQDCFTIQSALRRAA